MENTFLPGTVRQRLADLMKYHKVSQTDLALKIGCGDSLLSRFLTGKTDKIGDENIIRIANVKGLSCRRYQYGFERYTVKVET